MSKRTTAAGCRHFTGALNPPCKAGHVYVDMGRPIPCICTDRQGQCPDYAEWTDAELDEQDRQAAETFTRYINDLDANICPFCKTAIQRRKQVGRCVYAEPCNHRLYQGRT